MMLTQVVSRAASGSVESRVVHQPAMAEHSALGKVHGARGVLDLRGVTRCDIGQCRRARAFRKKRVAFHVRYFADGRNARRDLNPDLPYRVAAKLLDKEQGNRAGLLQHIGQLACLKGRIRGHQNQPGQRTGIFH